LAAGKLERAANADRSDNLLFDRIGRVVEGLRVGLGLLPSLNLQFDVGSTGAAGTATGAFAAQVAVAVAGVTAVAVRLVTVAGVANAVTGGTAAGGGGRGCGFHCVCLSLKWELGNSTATSDNIAILYFIVNGKISDS
jgi:hypothetical protein